ncbi:hypothetical protein EES44_24520 [Streptomyces sp. ADI96-15]|uniref:hypothetical protein n=1 Tax=Streptomyces sp. ADI96-15 TaxID=1522761 RepID=UPI000F5510EA|nr:hypothetical protein [Streptomyces sp. ADI96-15]RPK58100.1 hypothetical protein EES44_24520 [Streptomyces sp. ADI96-15]
MSRDRHAHPAQCCCCARANPKPEPEPEPFRLSDLADIPRTQWIGGGIMLAVIVVMILFRHG